MKDNYKDIEVNIEDNIDEKYTNIEEDNSFEETKDVIFIENEYEGEAENKFTYVRKSIDGYYVSFPDALNEDIVGYTYQDFIDNKWVLLNKYQLRFHSDYPNAKINEVINLKLDEVSLDEIKSIKLNELEIWDNSENVNSFTINNIISAWFTPTERTNYKNSIESAKLLGIDELSLFIKDTLITLETSKAELLLASLQLYADSCFIVTQSHKNNINKLETIEEVKDYDFKVGYPEKLNFNLFE